MENFSCLMGVGFENTPLTKEGLSGVRANRGFIYMKWNGRAFRISDFKRGVTSHQGGSGCSVISHSAGSTVIRLLSPEGGLSSERSHQAAVSWGWSLVSVVQAAHCIAHQGSLIRVVSSGYCLIRVVSSGCSLIRVVSHQGGLSSGWSLIRGLIRVVSHQGLH